jgi:hypothetical protein
MRMHAHSPLSDWLAGPGCQPRLTPSAAPVDRRQTRRRRGPRWRGLLLSDLLNLTRRLVRACHPSARGYSAAATKPRARWAAGRRGGAKAPKDGTRGSPEWPGHDGVELGGASAMGEGDDVARPTPVRRGTAAGSNRCTRETWGLWSGQFRQGALGWGSGKRRSTTAAMKQGKRKRRRRRQLELYSATREGAGDTQLPLPTCHHETAARSRRRDWKRGEAHWRWAASLLATLENLHICH